MLAYGPIPFWKDGRGLSAHRGVHSFLQPSNPLPALLSLSQSCRLGISAPSIFHVLAFLPSPQRRVSRSARPTLYDPMDGSPPASSVHRISQARILEGVAIPFSRGSSRKIFTAEPPGSRFAC